MQRGDLLCNFGVIVLKRLNVFLVPTSLDLIFQGGSWHPKWPAGIKGWPILKADTVIIVWGMKIVDDWVIYLRPSTKSINLDYSKNKFYLNTQKNLCETYKFSQIERYDVLKSVIISFYSFLRWK